MAYHYNKHHILTADPAQQTCPAPSCIPLGPLNPAALADHLIQDYGIRLAPPDHNNKKILQFIKGDFTELVVHDGDKVSLSRAQEISPSGAG